MSDTNFVDLSRAHLGEWRDNVTKYAGKADGTAEGLAAGAVLGAVGSTAKFLWSLRNKEGRTAAKEMISGWGKKAGGVARPTQLTREFTETRRTAKEIDRTIKPNHWR